MLNTKKLMAYTRVSTGGQSVESQKFEIERYCKDNNLIVNKYCSDEGVSGTVDYHKRKLWKLLKELKPGDTLICAELSRLGRSLFMIFDIMSYLQKKNITLITIKENLIFDDSITSKTILFAFSLSAEIERDLISKRTKEGLALRKAQGMHLGRVKGSKNKHHMLHKKHDQIINYIKYGRSRYYISHHIKCHPASLNNYLKIIKDEIKKDKWLYYGIS